MRSALSLGLVILALMGGSVRIDAQPGAARPSTGPSPGGTVVDTATIKALPISSDTAALPKSRSDTVLVVKHSFNHKEQIITGSVIMTCLALMMVTMNNYNPR